MQMSNDSFCLWFNLKYLKLSEKINVIFHRAKIFHEKKSGNIQVQVWRFSSAQQNRSSQRWLKELPRGVSSSMALLLSFLWDVAGLDLSTRKQDERKEENHWLGLKLSFWEICLLLGRVLSHNYCTAIVVYAFFKRRVTRHPDNIYNFLKPENFLERNIRGCLSRPLK